MFHFLVWLSLVVDCVDFDDNFGVGRDQLAQRHHVDFVPLEHALGVLVVDSCHKDKGERSQKTKGATICEAENTLQSAGNTPARVDTVNLQRTKFTEHAQSGPKVTFHIHIEFSC